MNTTVGTQDTTEPNVDPTRETVFIQGDLEGRKFWLGLSDVYAISVVNGAIQSSRKLTSQEITTFQDAVNELVRETLGRLYTVSFPTDNVAEFGSEIIGRAEIMTQLFVLLQQKFPRLRISYRFGDYTCHNPCCRPA